MSQLLVEKYRPKDLKDLIGFKPSFAIDETLPHLLLYGSPGTGKTTLARIIIRMLGCDSITLNASSERGIETIRQKVYEFASTKSTDSGIKIVFLDESDHLTPDAQTALRNTMETFSRNTRFILTANYVSRIIDPIKSRCVSIRFDKISKSDIIARLKYICEQEKIVFEDAALDKIVDQTGTDIRSAINQIEQMRDGVLMSKLSSNDSLAQIILDRVLEKDFVNARQILLDSRTDLDQFLKDFHDTIWKRQLSQSYKQYAVGQIAETCFRIGQVAWKEIQVENMLLNLINGLK